LAFCSFSKGTCFRHGFFGSARELGITSHFSQTPVERKNIDWIIANDVSRRDAGFASEFNEAVMISKDGREIHFPLMTKRTLADKIIDVLLER